MLRGVVANTPQQQSPSQPTVPPPSGDAQSDADRVVAEAKTAVASETLIETAAIAAAWRRESVIPYNWRRVDNQAGSLGALVRGEGGGIYVTCDRVPRRAYMKPCNHDPNPRRARAAREKICSDLAYDLKVNVPPVILARRENCGDDENCVAVSLVMFPAQFPWSLVKVRLPELTRAGELIRGSLKTGAAAAGLVFDTWTDQIDHSDTHDHNIIFGYYPNDDSRNALIFLDYAFSLGFGGKWDDDGYKKVGRAPFPPRLVDLAKDEHLKEELDRLEHYPEKSIREIVMRVPGSHLDGDEARKILDGLLCRREMVRDVIRGYGKEV